MSTLCQVYLSTLQINLFHAHKYSKKVILLPMLQMEKSTTDPAIYSSI
jgi:hypothetical protein